MTTPLWLSVLSFLAGLAALVYLLLQPDSDEERTKEPTP